MTSGRVYFPCSARDNVRTISLSIEDGSKGFIDK